MNSTESRVGKDEDITPSAAMQMFQTIIQKAEECVRLNQAWQQMLNRGNERVPGQ